MSALRRLAGCGAIAGAVVAGLCVGAAPVRAADAPTAEERLIAQAPAIVTLRGVFELRIAMAGQQQTIEIKSDSLGAVVDPSGLIVVLDPDAVAKRLEGSVTGLSVSIRTKGLKLIGADGSEQDVVQVVRDGVLGLGFLQVLDPAGPLPSIDLASGGSLAAGANLLGLKRLSRGFDHAPIVQRCYVTHRIEKPRLVWSISGDFDEMGLPVFDRDGRAMGVVSFQHAPEADDLAGAASSFQAVVLPLEPVLRALEQAKKRVPEALARAKGAAEGAKDGAATPTPPDPSKPEGAAPAPAAPNLPDAPGTPDAPKAPDAPK